MTFGPTLILQKVLFMYDLNKILQMCLCFKWPDQPEISKSCFKSVACINIHFSYYGMGVLTRIFFIYDLHCHKIFLLTSCIWNE